MHGPHSQLVLESHVLNELRGRRTNAQRRFLNQCMASVQYSLQVSPPTLVPEAASLTSPPAAASCRTSPVPGSSFPAAKGADPPGALQSVRSRQTSGSPGLVSVGLQPAVPSALGVASAMNRGDVVRGWDDAERVLREPAELLSSCLYGRSLNPLAVSGLLKLTTKINRNEGGDG